MLRFCCFFFFSSRRRHTRSKRDWSSDVCSSDLCREAIRHMRNLLIARVCGADSELIAATPDQRPAIAKAAALFSEEDLTRFFQILLQTDDDLRRKPDPRVHLEMGFLRLINASRLAPLEALLAELHSGAPSAANTG